MAFKDHAQFADPDLHLPFRGKVYRVPAVDYDTGIYFQKIYSVGVRAASGQDPTDEDREALDHPNEVFMARALGADLLAQMKDEGVPFKTLNLMALTVLMDTVQDRETAEAFWASEGKAKPQKGQKTGTRTRKAAATTTRKPASQSGTSRTKAAQRGEKS